MPTSGPPSAASTSTRADPDGGRVPDPDDVHSHIGMPGRQASEHREAIVGNLVLCGIDIEGEHIGPIAGLPFDGAAAILSSFMLFCQAALACLPTNLPRACVSCLRALRR